MKIQIEFEIFDDPEYCNCSIFNGESMCRYMKHGHCILFSPHTKLAFTHTESDGAYYLKCSQCKKVYQKVKGIEQTEEL